MSDIWITSEGLDIAFDEPEVQENIQVSFGEIKGKFISLDSRYNKLVFETSDVELAIKYIESTPTKATIAYLGFTHELSWCNHNYKIEATANDKLYVTIGDLDEK